MKRRLLTSVFSFSMTILVAPLFASAQTTDFSSALTRMDAIIAEMTALRAEFASLASQVDVTTPTPTVLGVTADSVLGDDLRYGSTNADIARVQRLLATDAEIYPYGVDSGYFGPKTQEAVRRFQSRFNLDTVGVIGPATKALLETFIVAYPDGQYPNSVLTKTIPTVSRAQKSEVVTATPGQSASIKSLKSITVEVDDGEYIVRSYKSSGERNRDLILYPDDFDELVKMIAQKLSVDASEVRLFLDEDTIDEEKNDPYSKDTAEALVSEADDTIDMLHDAIRAADDDSDQVAKADDHYDKARDEYKKAKTNLSEDDYRNAVKDAKDAIEFAEKGLDVL